MAAFVLPPGCLVVLALAGLALGGRRSRLGAFLVFASAAGLYALSIAPVARALAAPLQGYSALDLAAPAIRQAGAIVVLGGGRYPNAPEYGGDTVSWHALVRLRYGARLHRATGLPVLVAGGSVRGEAESEASLMAQTLERDFAVPVRWTEARSRNTQENALYTSEILEREGIGRIVLVTSALHMARSVTAFQRAGLEVIPAPTTFVTEGSGEAGVREWLPSASVFSTSAEALHEHLGRLWYSMRY